MFKPLYKFINSLNPDSKTLRSSKTPHTINFFIFDGPDLQKGTKLPKHKTRKVRPKAIPPITTICALVKRTPNVATNRQALIANRFSYKQKRELRSAKLSKLPLYYIKNSVVILQTNAI